MGSLSDPLPPLRYPPARRDYSVVDDYHSVLVSDPYRWLENPDSEETKAFVEAQAALTDSVLEECGERERLREQITKLFDHPRYETAFKRGGKYFHFHNSGLQAQSVLYVQSDLDSEAEVLLDPNALSEDGTVALSTLSISRDGKHLAYGLSSSGSDWVTIKVMRIADKMLEPDTISWVFILKEKLKQEELIDKLTLSPNVSHWIVRSYLLHYGYQDTVNSFDVESGIMSPHIPTPQENGFHEQGDAYELSNRKILRQFIMNGDIDSVFRSLHEWYPQIMQIDTSAICFLLHSQRFIEYIRAGQLMDAVKYARAELNKFFSIKPLDDLLEDVIALLAYEDPSISCVGHLLHQGQREFVADAVNAMVLTTSPSSKRIDDWAFSRLEKLLKQLTQCSLERRALYGEQGEAFDVHKIVHTRSSTVER